MPQVPILRIPFSDADQQELLEGWSNVLQSGFLTLGNYTSQFEELFREFTGAKYAISVSNGTAALEVLIRSLGLEGGSIIVPTNTFLASALAVCHTANRVIFADSDPETLSLDLEDVERKIESDTTAVMVVHIGGIITQAIEDLQKLCQRRGLQLIEDCAHAHGSTMNGVHAGLFGAAGGFSFFPTKTLTTGEGGMVITNDPEVYRIGSMIRNQGKNPELGNKISEFGHNWRLSEITAVLGVQQMHKSADILAQRSHIGEYYDKALQEFKGITPVKIPAGATSSYYKYLAYLDTDYDRAEVKRVMREKYEVSLPGEVYADLCHNEPIWDNHNYCGRKKEANGCEKSPGCGCNTRQDGFPGAEYISKHHICLPMYPGIDDSTLAYVIESLDRTLHQDLKG